MVAVAPEIVAWWLDEVRGVFLQAGDLFTATRASIFLVTLLAWTGREEEIPTVVDDLRYAVRAAGRHGELIFALYYLTNAVARGEDLEDSLDEALLRMRRCEEAVKTKRLSGANQGAGACERRSSMETQQVVQTQEQELKAERVQEELMMADDPFQVSLKAERVQEPAFAAVGAAVPLTSAFELRVNQEQPVTIELHELRIVITLHGTNAGAAGLTR
jgi:hypothetical protein